MRARARRRQHRLLPDQPCRMNIPAAWVRKGMGRYGPLKSDCPLECVRACRVCTGCRRDVDRARREIGIDVWIDGKTVRASRAHVPDHQCRCECSLTAATCGGPAGPSCGPARGLTRGSAGPSDCSAEWARPLDVRGGSGRKTPSCTGGSPNARSGSPRHGGARGLLCDYNCCARSRHPGQ